MDIFNSWLVTKCIAHRGFHDAENPENTIGAFNRAIEHDYVIELDVSAIEDGTPVIYHDETLKRLTGKDGYVKNIKNVDELKNYKILNSKYTIPTLQEVLKAVDGKTQLLIEIKDLNLNGNFAKNVYEILKDYKGEYAIMSFNPFVLKWFKLNAPDVIRGQLSSLFKDVKMAFYKKALLKRMTFNKSVSEPQFLAYKWEDLPNRFVKKYKHLPLIVWAVKSQQDYLKAIKNSDNVIFEGFEPRI